MTLLCELRRRGARVLAPLAAVAATAALLAACGGGTEQVQSFVPARLLVLGDESGMIVDDGSHDGFKYSLNDRSAVTAGKCLALPTPSQQIAVHYGFVFAECNPTAAVPKAFSQARVNAMADDPTTGLKVQLDGVSGLGATDMVMVTIGTNDVISLYEQKAAGALTAAQASAEATRRGTAAAVQVNRVLGSGARALVFTMPELGKSPYAITATLTDSTAATVITTLTTAFNSALRLGIDATDFDGRNYGLVLVDDVVAAMVRYPSSYLSSPANVKDGSCAIGNMPQGCLIVTDTTTPANSVASNTHLWASDRHLGPVALTQIAAQALSRAINNPF